MREAPPLKAYYDPQSGWCFHHVCQREEEIMIPPQLVATGGFVCPRCGIELDASDFAAARRQPSSGGTGR
jgi:hypothetical protein